MYNNELYIPKIRADFDISQQLQQLEDRVEDHES